MRGRKPIPVTLLKARGTFRKHRHAKRAAEPAAAGDLLLAPEWLSPRQRKIWDDAIAVAPGGLLRAIDQGLMAAFVVALDHHRTAVTQQTKLDADGAGRPPGTQAPSPYFRIACQTADLIVRYGAELGFSPTARARLGMPAPADDAA